MAISTWDNDIVTFVQFHTILPLVCSTIVIVRILTRQLAVDLGTHCNRHEERVLPSGE